MAADLFNPTSAAILTLSTGTVYAGVRFSRSVAALALRDDNVAQAIQTAGSEHALLMPVVLSGMLLLLFLAFQYIGVVLLLLGLGYAVGALGLVLYSALAAGLVAHSSPLRLLAAAVAGLVGLAWLLTGHWLANNALGCALCIVIIGFVRLPSARVACLVLCALVVFDVFWVFFSARLFGGTNVMVAVATQHATNPAAQLAQKALGTQAPPRWMAPSLSMLNKLVLPRATGDGYSMLGLGDIALPGILVDYAARVDAAHAGATGLLPVLLASYALGVSAALVSSNMFHAAQPALLFIVPAVLLAMLGRAAAHGRPTLALVWSGTFASAAQSARTDAATDEEFDA